MKCDTERSSRQQQQYPKIDFMIILKCIGIIEFHITD